MQIEKIYFDMDGVLADFDRGARELCHLSGEYSDDDLWEAIKKVDHFYFKLKPMPGAIDMVNRLFDKYGDKCEILSAIPKPHRNIQTAATDITAWIKEYFGENIKVNIVYRQQKKDFAKGSEHILFDDSTENIEQWNEAGGSGFVYAAAEEALQYIIEMEQK